MSKTCVACGAEIETPKKPEEEDEKCENCEAMESEDTSAEGGTGEEEK